MKSPPSSPCFRLLVAMSDDHHDHGHSHSHAPPGSTASFAIGVALNAGFVVVEGICGVRSGSLSLLADAGHNLSDVLGLLLAWGAMFLSQRRPSGRRTYGLRRTSIMAALANGLLLLVAVGAIAWEAIGRLLRPEPVAPATVMVVAALGVVVNTLTAMLFMSGRKHDLNVRGAFLHMAADAAVSLGVVVGGLIMSRTGWLWVDPALGLVIAAVIAYSTWDLLWQALDLALDSVPRGIDPLAVRSYLAALPQVTAVHDLHIWGLSTTETALTVHLVKPDAEVDDDWLHSIAHELHHRFGIVHATIQVENGRGQQACRLAPDEIV
jgi:cobalt-zinc-cadmium efflux system protein